MTPTQIIKKYVAYYKYKKITFFSHSFKPFGEGIIFLILAHPVYKI